MNFDKTEKEIINSLTEKLNGKFIRSFYEEDNDIDITEIYGKEIMKILSEEIELWRNETNDIRYKYILYYKDNFEIGLDIEAIDERTSKIRNMFWQEL